MTTQFQALKVQRLKILANRRRRQASECDKICQRIAEKDYHDASILIRYYLNDSRFIWYKPIERIIENQITNLFYDITHNKTSCYDFFNRQFKENQSEAVEIETRIKLITGGNI